MLTVARSLPAEDKQAGEAGGSWHKRETDRVGLLALWAIPAIRSNQGISFDRCFTFKVQQTLEGIRTLI